jgi:hypothetical protein
MRTPLSCKFVLLVGVLSLAACGEGGEVLGEGELCDPNAMNCAPGLMCFEVTRGEFRCLRQAPTPDARPADARLPDAMVQPAPDTFIDEPRPPQRTNTRMATFNLRSSQANSTFRCSVDGTPFATCPTPHNVTVGEGQHTFEVKAVNSEGTEDPTPARFTWLVDTMAPETTITSGPTPRDQAPSDVTFQFTSNEPGTFTCQMDDRTTETCTTGKNYAGLSVGAHTFRVFATDTAGNRDMSPAEYAFTVTQVVPETEIDCPTGVVADAPVILAFSSDQSGATFRCSVNGGAETTCTSPISIDDLSDGEHTLSVVAVNSAGVRDPSAAECGFELNAFAPVVTITQPRANQRIGQSAQIHYSVDPLEPGLTFVCTAGSIQVPCDSSGIANATGLPLGPITITVVVTDSVGNTSQDDVSAVVVAGPPVTVTLDPFKNNTTRSMGNAIFTVDSTGFPNITLVCTLNGNPVECVSPIPYNEPHGSTVTVEVTATDDDSGESVTGIASAVVDNEQPTIEGLTASGSDGSTPVDGADITIVFSSSDTVSAGAVFTCKLDGIEYTPCEPGVEYLVPDLLFHGEHNVTIEAVDLLGVPPPATTVTLVFFVDGQGPLTTLHQSPEGEIVCPTAEDDQKIQFYAVDPSPASPPITFHCDLTSPDGIRRKVTCDDISAPTGSNAPSGAVWGEYRWVNLTQHGAHMLHVWASDGRSPANEGPEIDIPFFVDHTPPTIEVTINSDLEVSYDADPNDANNPVIDIAVTSGGGATAGTDVGGYGNDDILVYVHDDSNGDMLDDHGPITLEEIIECEVLTAAGAQAIDCKATCAQVDWGRCPGAGDALGSCFVCDFWSLTSAQTKHTARLRIQDTCGPVNTGTGSTLWLVDSSPDPLVALDFTDDDEDGDDFVPRTPAGPASDIIDGVATAHIRMNDTPNTDEFDSSENPPANVSCLLDGNSVECPEVGDNVGFALFDIDLDLDDSTNPHTFSATATDGVGNASLLADVSFYVDTTAPVVTFPDRFVTRVDPEDPVNCDAAADGLQLSDESGTLLFTVNDDGTDGSPNPDDGIPTSGISTVTCTVFQVEAADSETGDAVEGLDGVSCDEGEGVDASLAFAGLEHGIMYRLRVDVADAVGNDTTYYSDAWRVDNVAPTITFASPRDNTLVARGDSDDYCVPPAEGEFDVENDKCTIFANIVPESDDWGAFDSEADDANQPITWHCFINNVLIEEEDGPCDPHIGGTDSIFDMDFPLNVGLESDGFALPEGAHFVEITAEDCVGNTNPESGAGNASNDDNPRQDFLVDWEPPEPVVAPVTVTDNTGHAEPSFTVTDAITNVQQGHCLIDFNDAGNNPETTTQANPSLPCVFDIGETLPTQTDVSTVTVLEGSLVLDDLSAGEHKIWYVFEDIWGHESTVASTSFRAKYTNDLATDGGRGHVVTLGHDFDTVGNITIGATTNIEKILGDAVALAPALALLNVSEGRGLRILALNLNDADVGVAADNALMGIDARLGELEVFCDGTPYCMSVSEFGMTADSYKKLQGHLYGRDVLLIYDQNNSAATTTIAADTDNDAAWEDILEPFLEDGGIVVILDGRDGPSGPPSNTVALLNGIVNLSPNDDTGLDRETYAEVDCDVDNPLADGVADEGNVPTTDYDVPQTTFVRFNRDADQFQEEIFSVFACVDLPSTAPCTYRPVVLDRIFPKKEGRGPVRITAFERGQPRGDESFALISLPGGAVDGFCRLRRDGTTTHDVTNGGSVSILSYRLPDASFNGGLSTHGKAPISVVQPLFVPTRTVQTVMNVQAYDILTVGSTAAPVTVEARANVTLPAFVDTDVQEYFVTVGCLSDKVADLNVRNTNFANNFVTSDCTFPHPTSGLPAIRAVAEARNNSGDTIAFTTSNAVVATGTDPNDVFVIPGTAWADWEPGPYEIILRFQNGSAATRERANVLLGSKVGGRLYDEGYSSTSADRYWSPIQNEFADSFRIDAVMEVDLTINTTARTRLIMNDDVPRQGVDPYGINRLQFFNRFQNAVGSLVGTSPRLRPQLTWTMATGLGLADVTTSLGGAAATLYLADDCPDPECTEACQSGNWVGIWEVFFPANQGVGAAMPQLPASLPGSTAGENPTCWAYSDGAGDPNNIIVPLQVSYFHEDEISANSYRTDPYSALETYLNGKESRPTSSTFEPSTRSTAFCTALPVQLRLPTSDTVDLVCPGAPACSDGIDNDGDGLVDDPNDPGCFDELHTSEEDSCDDPGNDPNNPPASCPECGNGIDDDNFGDVDGDDPDCDSAADTDEGERTKCSDGENSDGAEDNLIDLADPGCVDSGDNDEANPPNCPGNGCPQCFDGEDNDGDMDTDYGEDAQCTSAGDNSELN